MFFFKFIMIRLFPRHHPSANPSPPFPLCPAAGQRGRGGEGLAEAQLPHIFQDGVSPFAPVTGQSRPGCGGRRGVGRAAGGWAEAHGGGPGETHGDVIITCLQDCRNCFRVILSGDNRVKKY